MKTAHHRARVALEFRKMKEADLANFADGVAGKLTGNPAFASPPVAAATLSTQAAAMRASLAAIAAGNRSEDLTLQKKAAKIALELSLIADGHYVEDTANAAAAGDVDKAAKLIATTGFALAAKPAARGRTTGIVDTGLGWAHARAKRAARGEIHVWRYGLTAVKGTPPQTLITVITAEADVILRDLASGSVLAVQHAGVLPVGRGPAAGAATSKDVGALPADKSRHPVFSHAQPDPYAWGDFVYAVVP